MTAQSNTIVFGAVPIGSADRGEYGSTEGAQKILEILKEHGVTHIDTAQLYGSGKSEATLGEVGAVQKGFTIDTKWISGWTGEAWASVDKIVTTAKESLDKLNVKQGESLDIFYLHSPDVHTPFEETLKGVHQAYQNGGFKRFGLSNFTPAMTKKIFEICEKNGYIKPSVYQGSYSAAARRAEDTLFPLLREYKMSFYAYSPISGGFLTKNRKFVEDQQGRFAKDAVGGIYHKMYTKDNFMSLLDKWEEIANEEKVSKAELAFRWVNYHSALKPEHGDAVIFGASKYEQITTTIQYLRNGPLSDKAVKAIDALWPTVKDDSIMDNFEAVFGGSG